MRWLRSKKNSLRMERWKEWLMMLVVPNKKVRVSDRSCHGGEMRVVVSSGLEIAVGRRKLVVQNAIERPLSSSLSYLYMVPP